MIDLLYNVIYGYYNYKCIIIINAYNDDCYKLYIHIYYTIYLLCYITYVYIYPFRSSIN